MTKQTTDSLATAMGVAAEVIGGARSILLACHVDPDGDALGSMLALHHLCRAKGIASVASWSEPFVVAPHYAFLPGLDDCTKPADVGSRPEVMVTFDCGSIARLGDLAPMAEWARDNGELIVIDHHRSNDHYGTLNLVDPDAAASAVVVRRLAGELRWPLNRDVALCLYTGVVTDTGRFQYDNTTSEVFALADELASFDLPIAAMTRQLFEEHRFAYLQLMGDCLGRARLDADLGFVATWITAADLAHHGLGLEETEGLIDVVRQTVEAEVSCVLKETPAGVRVSLRSVDGVDVGAIALRFGGGGHRHAAGFIADGSVAQVLDAVRGAVAAGVRACRSGSAPGR